MDPNTFIETLRPKSVPENLVALGTVIQVTDNLVKFQITGGVVCIVPKQNISTHLTEHIRKLQLNDQNSDVELDQLFKPTQQYVCKILEKKPRKGYQDAFDIVATLDPKVIHDGLTPKGLQSVPEAPIQCSIQSIEDHGYQVDIGLKNLLGFLPFSKEVEKYCSEHFGRKKLILGQIISCCQVEKDVENDERRVLSLKLCSDMKAMEFVLAEKHILPGFRYSAVVMKVSKNGLIVQFGASLSGFITKDQLDQVWQTPTTHYKISQELECEVLYYNPVTKAYALTARKRKSTCKNVAAIIENYHIGKTIKKAKVEIVNGTSSLYLRLPDNVKAVANVRDVIENFAALTKDEVQQALDDYSIGTEHECRVKSINLADQLIVVSTLREFIEMPCMSSHDLKAGNILNAKVKKIVADGIVVTYGMNQRAIILNVNLQNRKLSLGQEVKCRVQKIDSHRQPQRVYLTNKKELLDPNLLIIDDYVKSFKHKTTRATIIKARGDGLIVETFRNVKGFIPKIYASITPIKAASDLFHVGQVVDCIVTRVNVNTKSMIFSIIPLERVLELKTAGKENRELKKAIKTDKKLTKAAKITDTKKKTKTFSIEEVTKETKASIIEKVTKETKPTKRAGSETKTTISRMQRSEEARQREESLRLKELELADPNRAPQSVLDFERLVLKNPNCSDTWIKYSNFFLNNIETEKARITCRRALKTINFRMEKDKLRVWLHLVKIEARYGGKDKIKEILDEAVQTNDKIKLYQGAIKILTECEEHETCERLFKEIMKKNHDNIEILLDRLTYLMKLLKYDAARSLFEKSLNNFDKKDQLLIKSRFGQLEFKLGDTERGKTIFETLLSDYPKRVDLWKIYQSMIQKHANDDETLERIKQSIDIVSKPKKKLKVM